MTGDNSGSAVINSSSTAAQHEQQQRQSQEDENRMLHQQNSTSLTPLSRHPPASGENDTFAEIVMNTALYDPPRWGWTAVGGIADVLSPHEVRYCSFGKPLLHFVRCFVVSPARFKPLHIIYLPCFIPSKCAAIPET